jgi:hypothetical protein
MVIGVHFLQLSIHSFTWKLTKRSQRTPIFEKSTIMHCVMMVWLGWTMWKKLLNSSSILNIMLSIGISISIGGLICGYNICCCNNMIKAVEVLVVEICGSSYVPEFRNNEGKDTCEEGEIFPSFELAMAWFTKIGWWSLYPCWKSNIMNAISYCL